jgi:hypothetical protein
MSHYRRLIIYLFTINCAFGQDESWIREAITKKKKVEEEKVIDRKISVYSDYFRVDFNADGYKDGFVIENSEAGQFIHLYDAKKKPIKSFHFAPRGTDAGVLQVDLKYVSPTSHTLLIYHYEGRVMFMERLARLRLYLIHLSNDLDPASMKLFKGPILFEEYETTKHRHMFKKLVYLEDLNNDGHREVVVESKNTRKNVISLNKNYEWVYY